MYKLLTLIRLPLLVCGLLVVLIADRYLGAETYHMPLRISGIALVGLALVATLLLAVMTKNQGLTEEAKGWRTLCLWPLGVLISLGLYWAYSKVLGDTATPETPAGKILLGAWLVTLALALAAGIGGEWSMRLTGRGTYAEPSRVNRASLAWLSIGMLFAFLVSVNYIGDKKDKQRDLSYLKINTPSEVTQHMVKTLTDDLTISLFYPPGNEVRSAISDYFKAVAALDPHVKLTWYDKDVDPVKAEELRVAHNGMVIVDMKGKKGRLDIGTSLAKARKQIKDLDSDFQKAFLETTSARKTIYFSRGHGELSWVGSESGDNPLRSLRLLEGFLRQQNYSTRLFGISEGSATAIPDDAAAVVIVGPTEPFQAEEIEVLRTFVKGGGNLMVFADIDKSTTAAPLPAGGHQPLYDLLGEIGLNYQEVPLGNEKNHVVATHSESDVWVIYTNVFTSHESVINLARHDERVALLLYQSGYFKLGPENPTWKVTETVRSSSDTFADENRNFKFDPAEKRQAFVIGAVAELKNKPVPPPPKDPKQVKVVGDKDHHDGRIVVFADASAISDALIRNIGNAFYFADSLKWLVGETALQGEMASEEDVKIRHTRKEDARWFYGTVVFVPLLVLGAGFLATRRKKIGDTDSDKAVAATATRKG